jgi:hypothetical protein
MKTIVNQLINEKEELYLEFKSQWYWEQNVTPTVKQWGEFLKDFVGLINCSVEYVEENKYLIIGINENEQELSKRIINTDIIDNKFSTLDELKVTIIDKLSEYFLTEEDIKYHYDNFSLNYYQIDEKKILVFEIRPTKYILVLQKDLQDKNRTEKKNNVFVRAIKDSGDPEVLNASPKIILELKEKINQYKLNIEKEEKLQKSKEKTINLYVQNNSIFSLSNPIKEKIWKSNGKSVNILYELYPVKSDFANIDFIYIYDATNQTKTYEYLKKNKIVSNDAQRWILIDDGLKKDIEGIKKKFEAQKVFSLDEFALEYLYKDYFENDTYHQGNFKKQKQVKNFIEPFTVNQTEKNALILLLEWYKSLSKPLIAIKGFGGVGKTTLVKYFLDDLYNKNLEENLKLKILFIDSKDILSEIYKQGKVNNVYDFYNAFATKKELEKKLNKELLELSVDNGNLLIVLDGIDEVIAKLAEDFDVDSFISTIYNNYSLGNEKTKIIVTCRDYFWNRNNYTNFNIDTIELKPFNIELVKKFFSKYFDKNSKDFTKSLSIADEFALEDQDEKIYLPYILDIIADMIKQQKEFGKINKNDIETKLLNKNLTNDYFVGRICTREIEKLKNFNVDMQLRFFMNMAVFFNGEVTSKSHKKVLKGLPSKDTEILDKFKGHPLINYKNDIFYFRYDFFREYFINLFLSEFFILKDIKNFDENIKELLIDYVKYDSNFTKYICQRVIFDDELKLFIIELIENVVKNIQDYNDRILISSLLTILLLSLKLSSEKNDIETRTQLLIDIFGKNLDYLTIIDVFGEDGGGNYPVFDFTKKKINHAWFENYQYFWESKIDVSTFFINSTFKELNPREGIKLPTIHNSLFEECNTVGIVELLNKENELIESKQETLSKKLLKIFRHFEDGGSFKEKKIEDTRKKCDTVVLDKLLKHKIITPYKNSSRPTLKQYKVADDYIDIINILSQGGSNFEFEKVVKVIMEIK